MRLRRSKRHAPPSRSAGAIVSPSVGRLSHSWVPSSAGGEERHAALLLAAKARAGS